MAPVTLVGDAPISKRHSLCDWLLCGCGANAVEVFKSLFGQIQRCSLEILSQVLRRRCARDQQEVRRSPQQPRERYLHGSGFKRRGYCIEPGRLQRGEPSQWKVRHVGDALRGESIDESVVGALGDVVEVLDAHNLRDSLRLSQLPGRDRAETDMPNQALLLQFGKRRQRFFKGVVRWSAKAAEAKIDDIECIKAEIAQVVVNL